jgi:hypothetical protein
MVIILSIDNIIKNEILDISVIQKDKEFMKSIPIVSELRHFIAKTAGFHFFISNYSSEMVKKLACDELGYFLSEDYCNQVLLNANKINPKQTFDFLLGYAYDLDPDVPMIKIHSDRWEFILVTDNHEDLNLGEQLNIRTILLDHFYKNNPKSALSLEEIALFIKQTEIINQGYHNFMTLWTSEIENYNRYNKK